MPEPFAPFRRHVEHCNNVVLPGEHLAVVVAGEPIGFTEAWTAALACEEGLAEVVAGTLTFETIDALVVAGRALAKLGFAVWRDEDFDVRSDRDGRVLGRIDRGVLPNFGIAATGVHLNGLVDRDDGPQLWIARRAADKLLDPGKLDHLAAGGVGSGYDGPTTLAKEAEEECGLSAVLAGQAIEVSRLRYTMRRPEGLRRDTLICYDVTLPADWTPVAQDGEVEAFELWPLNQAVAAVRDGEAFKFNVNLVLIDLFIRRGLVEPPDDGFSRR